MPNPEHNKSDFKNIFHSPRLPSILIPLHEVPFPQLFPWLIPSTLHFSHYLLQEALLNSSSMCQDLTTYFPPVLVPCCCCNKLPPTW